MNEILFTYLVNYFLIQYNIVMYYLFFPNIYYLQFKN